MGVNLLYGWICNVDELRCGQILQYGRIRNMGEFQFAPTTHAKEPMPCPWCFFVCLHTYLHDICQRSDNTRVGANCNSPIHCRQFALPLRAIRPPIKGNWKHRWICNVDEFCNMGKLWCGRIAIRPYNARKRPHAMPVMLFAYNICQRSDNARVGAKSASWRSWVCG